MAAPVFEVRSLALANRIQALDDLVFTAEGGSLANIPLRTNRSGEWHVDGQPPTAIQLGRYLDGEIRATSASGSVRLINAFISHQGMSSTGHWELSGVAGQVQLSKSESTGTKSYQLLVTLKANPTDKITFPNKYVDLDTGVTHYALLPLVVANAMFNIYPVVIDGTHHLVFDTKSASLSPDEARSIVNSARSFLAYLTGLGLVGDTCEIIDDGVGNTVILWYGGRDRREGIFSAIPVAWGVWNQAKKALGTDGITPLDPQIISPCLEKFHNSPSLITPVEYIVISEFAPIEMRGALLSVALESLADYLVKDVLKATFPKPLADAEWDILRRDLLEVARTHRKTWPQGAANIIEGRLSGINSPSNRDKLSMPFKLLGIYLTPEQLSSIARRNTYLHEGRLIEPERLKDEPDAWREAYQVEARLLLAINKLLLKHLGYTGPVVSWEIESLYFESL